MVAARFTAAFGLACLGVVATAQTACNGYAELCGRLYSTVTFVGAHDSAFVGTAVTKNQYVSVADQLSSGVRMLQSQTHDLDGEIEMCHTSCLLEDAGTLASFLANIKTFLDANPNEVVTLLLTNQDNIPVSRYWAVLQSAGLDAVA